MVEDIGFLFDNDGVLMDSCALIWRSWQLLMDEEKELRITHEQFEQGLGKTNALLLAEIAPNVSEETRERWAERREAIYRGIAVGHVSLIEGMEDFLQQVVEAGFPRIIASSTAPANLQLYVSSTVLGEYFENYVSAEEVAHSKPYPDIFLEAAERIGLPPEQCIVLEDAPAGVEAGKRAGCFVIALGTTHPKEKLPGYDLFYPSPAGLNLPDILEAFRSWSMK